MSWYNLVNTRGFFLSDISVFGLKMQIQRRSLDTQIHDAFLCSYLHRQKDGLALPSKYRTLEAPPPVDYRSEQVGVHL